MRIQPECIACIVNQAVAAPKLYTSDPELRMQIVRDTLAALQTFDPLRTPPEMGGALSAILSQRLGLADPYAAEKQRANAAVLALSEELRRAIDASCSPFEAAVRLAIAGNAIDCGIPEAMAGNSIEAVLRGALSKPLLQETASSIRQLEAAARRAERIVYLLDNAGEIALDRLLIERLPQGRVTAVVRSGPAINDALLADAKAVGLPEIARVMESGAQMPGTPLGRCSAELRALMAEADLIVSKGQGNFETLDEERGPFFFLLVAKCAVVAQQTGSAIGDFVVRRR